MGSKIGQSTERLVGHPHFLPLGLSVLIFTVYFSSAVGLYNSMDTPQYFTTEGLIRYRDPDLTPFVADPHYFVYPDSYYHNSRILGLRGYLLSFFAAPLHLVSHRLKNLYTAEGFPTDDDSVPGLPIKVSNVPNFTYELSITSLFTLFSTVGLMLFWKTAVEMTSSRCSATAVTLLMAFGTYIWKYSTSYIRQGFMVLLLGLTLYCVWKWFSDGQRLRWLLVFWLCWSVSFGIDVILFCALTAYISVCAAYLWWQTRLSAKADRLPPRHILYALALAGPILAINIALNYHWYGTLLFAQNNRITILEPALGGKANDAWLSTPLYPTVVAVLFGAGTIPAESFSNFDSLPREVAFNASLDRARTQNFFGLFAISPFLLFGIPSLFNAFDTRRHGNVLLYCLLVFALSILATSKVLVFWAGNQFDVRYFYPYVLLLGIPVALWLQHLSTAGRRWKIVSLALFAVAALFSCFMGWLGVIGMFRPALTGERRIWVDLFSSMEKLPGLSLRELVDATAMNWRNAWIAVAIVLFLYVFFRVVSYLIAGTADDRSGRP